MVKTAARGQGDWHVSVYKVKQEIQTIGSIQIQIPPAQNSIPSLCVFVTPLSPAAEAQ